MSRSIKLMIFVVVEKLHLERITRIPWHRQNFSVQCYILHAILYFPLLFLLKFFFSVFKTSRKKLAWFFPELSVESLSLLPCIPLSKTGNKRNPQVHKCWPIRKSIFILKILIILLHQWQNFHVSVGDDESLIIRTMIVRSKKFDFLFDFYGWI